MNLGPIWRHRDDAPDSVDLAMTTTSHLPTGTVTFFFSDVEGSTGLLQRLAEGYRGVIERHAEIIRRCLAVRNGTEVSTEGDSFFAVFTSAGDAVAAAADIQQHLAAEPWPPGGTVAVRIGLHTGSGELGRAGDVYTMGWALRWVGLTAVEFGDPVLGARLAGASAAAVERSGGPILPPLVPVTPALERATALIDDQADEAFEASREIGLAEAIGLARELP